MNKFKVTLQRKLPKEGNPFYPGRINETAKVMIRTWEIEAENEEEIRKYYEEAKLQDLDNVRGFDLRSIEICD